jgi:hypothetical protein
MAEPIRLVIEFLENMIDDAESRITGRGSILDYGMRIRRQTAEDIFRHVQSLAGTAQAARTIPNARPATPRHNTIKSEFGPDSSPSAGFGNLHTATTGADIGVRVADL